MSVLDTLPPAHRSVTLRTIRALSVEEIAAWRQMSEQEFIRKVGKLRDHPELSVRRLAYVAPMVSSFGACSEGTRALFTALSSARVASSQAAELLNAAGHPSPEGRAWTRRKVQNLRTVLGAGLYNQEDRWTCWVRNNQPPMECPTCEQSAGVYAKRPERETWAWLAWCKTNNGQAGHSKLLRMSREQEVEAKALWAELEADKAQLLQEIAEGKWDA